MPESDGYAGSNIREQIIGSGHLHRVSVTIEADRLVIYSRSIGWTTAQLTVGATGATGTMLVPSSDYVVQLIAGQSNK